MGAWTDDSGDSMDDEYGGWRSAAGGENKR